MLEALYPPEDRSAHGFSAILLQEVAGISNRHEASCAVEQQALHPATPRFQRQHRISVPHTKGFTFGQRRAPSLPPHLPLLPDFGGEPYQGGERLGSGFGLFRREWSFIGGEHFGLGYRSAFRPDEAFGR